MRLKYIACEETELRIHRTVYDSDSSRDVPEEVRPLLRPIAALEFEGIARLNHAGDDFGPKSTSARPVTALKDQLATEKSTAAGDQAGHMALRRVLYVASALDLQSEQIDSLGGHVGDKPIGIQSPTLPNRIPLYLRLH